MGMKCKCSYKMHNVALKWFRKDCEENGLHEKDYDMRATMLLPPMERLPPPAPTTAFNFIQDSPADDWRAWCPIWMLANLREESQQKVIWGPQLRQDNRVVSIKLGLEDQYDHCRERVKLLTSWTAVAACDRLALWHFVIERSDGSRCWLHPTFTKPTFNYGEEDQSQPAIQPPIAGRGSSDYKGHYKNLKHAKVTGTLKFVKDNCA